MGKVEHHSDLRINEEKKHRIEPNRRALYGRKLREAKRKRWEMK